MRTHYGPWQPCWISNQHQKHKYGRGPSSEHFWQVWLKSVQRFQRRRFKCEKLTDGRTTDAYPWQKLTWPMARWAKKNICRKEKGKSMWLHMAACTSCVNNNMCCIRLVVNHSVISNSKYSCLMTLEINFEIIIQLSLKLLDDISSSSVFSAPQQNIYWMYSVYSRYLKKKLSLMWLWLRKLNSNHFIHWLLFIPRPWPLSTVKPD